MLLLLLLLPLPQDAPPTLGRFARDAGWVSLFDERTTEGWRGCGRDAFPAEGWEVKDGCLHHLPQGGGGDLVTTRELGDFELEFEWRVASGGNSGLKYRVREKPGSATALGPEYQVLDDAAHGNGARPQTSAGALYDFAPSEQGVAPAAGEFHRGRIVARGSRIEHWLDGERRVALEVGSEDWEALRVASKFRELAEFAAPGPGRIAIQDHGDEVWFRNIRVRELPGPAGSEAVLYDGTLAGWREVGDAEYEADGDTILGYVGGGAQSFLISERHFGDFILEVDVKTEEPGNSGIQIRSHQKENGRVFGYQVEIDSSERAWSGGLYDEARRGWLDDLADDEAARAAFQYQEWNRYRIEAIGPWLKVWVDGVPTADYFDTADLEGFFALQVHSGNDTRVRWRQPRLWDLGTREWIDLGALEEPLRTNESRSITIGRGAADRQDPVLKFGLRVEAGELFVQYVPSGTVSAACESSAPMSPRSGGGWCLRPALAEAYEAGAWNEIALGFDGDRCALEVGGRSAWLEAEGSALRNGSLVLTAAGDDAHIELRDLHYLSDPRR